MWSMGTKRKLQACQSFSVHSLRTQSGLVADFELANNGITMLLGANGSGKSTLLRTILGLLKPVSGSVSVLTEDGIKHTISSSYDCAQYVSFVPQSFMICQDSTVANIVALGGIHNIWMQKTNIERLDYVLHQMGIEHLQSRFVSTLSGGELARVSLARALMQNTPFLFVDEGDAALDLGHRCEFYALLEHLAIENGQGILMVTHNPESALRRMKADILLLVMPSGKLVTIRPEELTGDILSQVYGTKLSCTGADGGWIIS